MLRALLQLSAALALSALSAQAWAIDVQVSSTTSAQVYEVQGGQPGLFLTRRRVTERLTLQVAGVLPREAEEGYRGPRISASLVLRLDTDFGFARQEINPASELWFVPGYDPYAVDLMIGEVVVRDLFRRTTDLRAGRLISLDPTGFSAVDGLEVALRLPVHLRLWVATGAEVVSGERLSSGNFEVDGVLRMRRDDLFDEQHPEFEQPPTRLVVAGGAEVTDLDWLSAELAYRQGIVIGGDRTSYQRLAGTASFRAGPFRGGVIAAGDFALGALDELTVELGLRPLSWLLLSLSGGYTAPVFDADSIFAAFWSEPSLDVELRFETRLWDGLVLGASGIFEQAGFLSADAAFDPEGQRFGGSLYGRLRWRWLQAELRGRLGAGYGGRRVAVTGRLLATLPGRPLSFDLRGIVLGLRDDLAPQDHVVSLGFVIGARYEMTHDAALILELEHNASDERGQEFRFLALLDLGVWL